MSSSRSIQEYSSKYYISITQIFFNWYNISCIRLLFVHFPSFSRSLINRASILAVVTINMENFCRKFGPKSIYLISHNSSRVCVRNFSLVFHLRSKMCATTYEHLLTTTHWNDCTWNWKSYMVKIILCGKLLEQNKQQ